MLDLELIGVQLFRDAPVDRGHADALQPRVLEVLRVSSCPDYCRLSWLMNLCAQSHGLVDKAIARGNKINTTVSVERALYVTHDLSSVFFQQAIWHPGPDGGIEVRSFSLGPTPPITHMFEQRASRIPNITAPRGLYPFNVGHIRTRMNDPADLTMMS